MKAGRSIYAMLGLAAGIGALSATASAGTAVTTASAVYVERLGNDDSRRLEPAAKLTRGDRVVTLLSWQRDTRGRGFIITNPVPPSLTYQASADDDQEVSVDGGRTWGRLSELWIGSRRANSSDVTHIRWRISPDSSTQNRGMVTYSGIVR